MTHHIGSTVHDQFRTFIRPNWDTAWTPNMTQTGHEYDVWTSDRVDFWMSMTGAGHLHDYVNHEMLNICRETSHYIFVKQQVTKKEKHSKASYYTKRNFYRKVKITLITWCENVQLLHYETTAVIQMLFLIMNILFLFAHWSFIWTQNW